MILLLGVADNTQGTDSSLLVPLICIGIIAAAALLALLPLLIASLRRHRSPQALLGGVVLWAAVSIGVGINTVMTQKKWQTERQYYVNSGDYSPKDSSGAPPMPVALGGCLAVAYVGLLVWAVASGSGPGAAESSMGKQ